MSINDLSEKLVGKTVPTIEFQTRVGHEWVKKTSDDYFKGKKVVLFALPGAYTPTCSSTHLPRYNELFDTFKENGIDEVVCLSVNDSFVMNAWQDEQKASNLVMLPDGNGEFSEKLGFLVDKSAIGFGKRSWRYSMLVNDGKIEKVFVEEEKPGDPFSVSDADTMLKHLGAQIPKSATIFSRPGCPHCAEAKSILDKNKIKYEEHILNKDYTIKTLMAVSGTTTVPQVFMNGERIGGADNLKKIYK